MLVAAIAGEMPVIAKLATLILLPATGVATLFAQDLLSEPRLAPYLWPLVVPAVVPPTVIAFSLWSLIPDLRRGVSTGLAVGVFIAGLSGVCIALAPMKHQREAEMARLDAERDKIESAYANLPADATLAELLPFLDTRKRAARGRGAETDSRAAAATARSGGDAGAR